MTECDTCSAGNYSELWSGSTKCLECSPGTFSSNGSSTCSSCPRGRFTTHNASTECEICLSGHHTNGLEEGSSVCLKCDPGMSILFYPLRFISALLTSLIHNQNRHVFIHKLHGRMCIVFERTLHVKERIDILRDMSRGNETSPRHWEFEM